MEFKSVNYTEALSKFANWIETNEKRLNSACHCEDVCQWKHVICVHQNLQNEVEDFGKRLNCELKSHLNEDEACAQTRLAQATDLEKRWHQLWLKSLEQLVVVERTRRCPKHNTTIIGKPNSTNTANNKTPVKPQRIRPISYPNNHSERLEWDYRYTLSLTGCHKENGSQIDLDSVDEQVTKNLTEFGENYELWFGKDDELASVTVHSRPPSVEPSEKPELARAVTITSDAYNHADINPNLLKLTTPSSMFSVEATKCSHNSRQSHKLRLIGYPLLFAIIALVFCTIAQDQHHWHKSFGYNYPPV